MKKLVSFVLATVLCLGMTTAVMATPSSDTGTSSPVVDNIEIDIPDAMVDANGNSVSGAPTTEDMQLLNGALSEIAPADEDTGEPVVDEEKTIALFAGAGVTVAEVDEVYYAYIDGAHTGEVTFTVEAGNTTDKWSALVAKQDKSGWEPATVVSCTATTVTITSSHYCPVLLVRDSYTAPTYVPPLVFPTESTSPKTADVTMFGLCAVVALAGVVGASRKVKENK